MKLFLEKYQSFKFDPFTEVFDKFSEKLREEAECVENEFLRQLESKDGDKASEVKEETVESSSSSDDDSFGGGFGVQVNWKVS